MEEQLCEHNAWTNILASTMRGGGNQAVGARRFLDGRRLRTWPLLGLQGLLNGLLAILKKSSGT